MRVRHLPIELEAHRIDTTMEGNAIIVAFLGDRYLFTGEHYSVTFSALDGSVVALVGDWIVSRGEEFYVLAPTEFFNTFEEIT